MTSPFRFHFELTPMDRVLPWGGDGQRTLHWFGLTDGRYWIEGGGHHLAQGTDYYVVRLWEDVNVLHPHVWEPVPVDLEPFVASDPAQWTCDPLDFIPVAHIGRDMPDHPVVAAGSWHSRHYLDFTYLLNAPRARLWRTLHGDRDLVTLDWRHPDDGEIRFSVSAAAYQEAVEALDRELMTAMRQRIEELEHRGGIPGVEIDLADLRRDHEERTGRLARTLARTPHTDWDAVRIGADRLLGAS